MSIELYNEDCFETMKRIPNESVDLILCDLPFQETGNYWDKKLDLKRIMQEYERLIKPTGAIVLNATFRFAVALFNSAPHLYKYDWIWCKDNGTNAPNVNLQPFRIHEHVLVFGKGRVTNGTKEPMKYHPQKTVGKPYSQTSGRMSENWKGGLGKVRTDNPNGLRHPKTIQKFIRDKGGFHPTQKPVKMMEYFIRTYTDVGDVVLDTCMGSGSTGIACKNLDRNFIGVEVDEKYFNIAKERIGV